jgi:hypothetical protein
MRNKSVCREFFILNYRAESTTFFLLAVAIFSDRFTVVLQSVVYFLSGAAMVPLSRACGSPGFQMEKFCIFKT